MDVCRKVCCVAAVVKRQCVSLGVSKYVCVSHVMGVVFYVCIMRCGAVGARVWEV